MTQHADWPAGRTIQFKLGPALVVLTEDEVRRLLASDLAVFEAGLQRGKAVRRRQETRRRVGARQVDNDGQAANAQINEAPGGARSGE